MLHGNDVKRTEAAQSIVSFIDELAASRRKQSAADFTTYIVQAQVQGRSLTDEEVRGIGVLFLIAGLDTVAAALGFDLAYLARNPENQESPRRESTRIATAVEELLAPIQPFRLSAWLQKTWTLKECRCVRETSFPAQR
ncbi:cytochrome P450 [Rhizobium leguminosarum]|uniref:cytochrome P450 n=1 Tax=Rhizobium leguminosarum TaxID=384 RepID=UPI003965694E